MSIFPLACCKGEKIRLAVLVINCKLRANFLKFRRIGLNVAISTMSTCAASFTNFLYRYKPRVIWTRPQVHTWVVRIPAADFVSAARISEVRYPVIVFDMFIGHIYARYNIVLINTWLQIASLIKTQLANLNTYIQPIICDQLIIRIHRSFTRRRRR